VGSPHPVRPLSRGRLPGTAERDRESSALDINRSVEPWLVTDRAVKRVKRARLDNQPADHDVWRVATNELKRGRPGPRGDAGDDRTVSVAVDMGHEVSARFIPVDINRCELAAERWDLKARGVPQVIANTCSELRQGLRHRHTGDRLTVERYRVTSSCLLAAGDLHSVVPWVSVREHLPRVAVGKWHRWRRLQKRQETSVFVLREEISFICEVLQLIRGVKFYWFCA
jgi:hypothetical protein